MESGKLRFSREGEDVSRLIGAGTSGSLAAEQGEEFGTEAECSLLELVEAGLPEWVEWSRAETFTPREFRGPIAVLQEVPPECLDEAGRFVEPGWRLVEEALQREASPEKLEQLRFDRRSLCLGDPCFPGAHGRDRGLQPGA